MDLKQSVMLLSFAIIALHLHPPTGSRLSLLKIRSISILCVMEDKKANLIAVTEGALYMLSAFHNVFFTFFGKLREQFPTLAALKLWPFCCIANKSPDT